MLLQWIKTTNEFESCRELNSK